MDLQDNLPRVEYFDFEKDFMDDNVRCIPMIVRFKLDACEIKLKLKDWNKMSLAEREQLAILPIASASAITKYKSYLEPLIARDSRGEPTFLSPDQQNLSWMDTDQIPQLVSEKLKELNKEISLAQWKSLDALKRYALMKLSRPGHENRNFPKALKEFGLI